MKNLFTILQKDLELNYKLVVPAKNEIYQIGDCVVIKYTDKLKKNVQLAKLSKASALVKKHIYVSKDSITYRKK